MGRGSNRDISLVRMWRRRHAHGWVSAAYEYADRLFAGAALPPAEADRLDPVPVIVYYTSGPPAMQHADFEVARLSNHQCTEACERWIPVPIDR